MKNIFIIILSFLVMGCQKIHSSNQAATATIQYPAVSLFPQDESRSLYQLKDVFTTENSQEISLDSFQGKPVLVSMIYTSCAGACPRLVADLQRLEEKLGADKEKVHFLLVSFDVSKDTSTTLKKYAQKHHLDKNWTLLHGSKESVRTLSVLLNVSYAKQKSGIYTHDNKISLLDENGILRYQEEGLENVPDKMLGAIYQLIDGKTKNTLQ